LATGLPPTTVATCALGVAKTTLREGIGRLDRAWRAYRGALDVQGPRQVEVIV
jgi:hypothetical protein